MSYSEEVYEDFVRYVRRATIFHFDNECVGGLSISRRLLNVRFERIFEILVDMSDEHSAFWYESMRGNLRYEKFRENLKEQVRTVANDVLRGL